MGKSKRARQKFHLAAQNLPSGVQTKDNPSTVNLPCRIQPSENIFAGLDIDVINLKKSLAVVDDDGKSVRSIAKSIKSCATKQLKKEDKLKLRHNLFISNIDAIYNKMKTSQKNKKKKPETGDGDSLCDSDKMSTVEYLLAKNPVKVKKNPINTVKQKGIKKAKERSEALLKDIESLKKIFQNPKFTANPLEHIKNTVQERVVAEAL